MILTIAGALHLAAPACHAPCQAALIANAEFEAGPALNPCSTSGSGIGLWQLAGTHRHRFLSRYGQRWCSVSAQVEYVVEALGEMGLRERLFAATDPGWAAAYFAGQFERPRRHSYGARAARARQIFMLLNSTALVWSQ